MIPDSSSSPLENDISLKLNHCRTKLKDVISLFSSTLNIAKTDRIHYQDRLTFFESNLFSMMKEESNSNSLKLIEQELDILIEIFQRSKKFLKHPDKHLGKLLISEKIFSDLMVWAGISFNYPKTRSYIFHRRQFRIFYFLLFHTGKKMIDLMNLTLLDIQNMLDYHKIDYEEIKMDLEEFFKDYKWISSCSLNKERAGDMGRLVKILNEDLAEISKELGLISNSNSVLTTHSFRYSFIQKQLKFKSLLEIGKEFNLGRLDHHTYF